MFNTIKKQLLQARKDKNVLTRQSLVTLLSECETIGKKHHREPTDAECTAVLNSFIKKCKQTIEALHSSDNEYGVELKLYESFLPQQLTDDELRNIISNGSFANMGLAMKFLKEHYNGQYNGKTASLIAKELL